MAGLVAAKTQTSRSERACLCKHAIHAQNAVEIGTFMGVTAAELAKALPQGAVLFCVDPYFDGQSIQSIAVRHLARQGQAGKVSMIQATAKDALTNLPSQVDFIFVDGDHSYEGLKEDWEIVKRILRPGGIAAFHDVNPQPEVRASCEGAIQCFEELIRTDPDFQMVETCESLHVMMRVSHGK
jgi:predicted O-methyltransferase YrrM